MGEDGFHQVSSVLNAPVEGVLDQYFDVVQLLKVMALHDYLQSPVCTESYWYSSFVR